MGKKVVDVVVLGGRTKSVCVENTDNVAVALEKANICANGYDIFNENGETLTTDSVVGETTQISLTKQVKGNIENYVVLTWLQKRKVEIVEEYDNKKENVVKADTLQTMFEKANEEMKNYIIENDIKNVSLPKFTSITNETILSLEELENEMLEKLENVNAVANEIDLIVGELAEDTETATNILIARKVIDKNYNIL